MGLWPKNHSCVVVLTQYTIFKIVYDVTLRVVILSVSFYHLNADRPSKLEFLELEIMLLHKNRPGVVFLIYICTFLVNPAHFIHFLLVGLRLSVLSLYVCVIVQMRNHSHFFSCFPLRFTKKCTLQYMHDVYLTFSLMPSSQHILQKSKVTFKHRFST